jgi:serine/threonine protein kinase
LLSSACSGGRAVSLLPANDEGTYIKQPKLTTYYNSEDQNVLVDLLLQEVYVLEHLKCHPHPNIGQYRGCVMNRGHIVGNALKRYYQTLERRVKDGRKFDGNLRSESVSSAIQHLHSLGYAHNDLNPTNITVDQEDKPFLIDFGSCQPFGEDLITTGTRGWMEDEWSMTSKKPQGKFFLDRLRSWLVSIPAGKDVSLYQIQHQSKRSGVGLNDTPATRKAPCKN